MNHRPYARAGLLLCCLVSLGLLSLPVWKGWPEGAPEWVLFLGRFHPMVVHLPIGIMVLALFLELASWMPNLRHLREAVLFTLGLGVVTLVAATLLGWCLSMEGGYQEALLWKHQWLGVATAIAGVWTFFLHGLAVEGDTPVLGFLYRVFLLGTFVLLSLTGHWGGSLTHGKNYLFEYMPTPLRGWLHMPAPGPGPSARIPAEDPAVYPDLLRPVFETRCMECHGPEKHKGDLRLDSYPAILRGGDLGPAVVPGRPGESELVFVITLPPGDPDIMPPEDKTPLTPEEIRLIVWWVEQGAPPDALLSELKPTDEIRRLVKTIQTKRK